MSSPPSTQSSYHPAPLSNPRKRPLGPSLNTGSPDNAKRRKPSTLSAVSSGHPLRQASFPPPDDVLASRQSSFSPAVSNTGRSSVINGGKRGRGGRRKAADARSQAGTSAAGTAMKAGSAAGKGSAVNGAGQYTAEEEDVEEDEDDGMQDAMLEAGTIPDEAQQKLEREHLRMLLEAFNPEQADRYDMWRRAKLNKPVVRRLVNQTLSQSVPQSIVVTVTGYTKIFAGELIERAREVQNEWLACSPTLPTNETNPNYPRSEPIKNGAPEQASAGTNGDAKDSSDARPVSRDRSQCFEIKEMDKGPLTPDHLREALRRYKRDREGEGTGYQGLSLYGRANTASRTGGKRIFR